VAEAVHSPPSSVDAKNEWSHTPTPPMHLDGVYKKSFSKF